MFGNFVFDTWKTDHFYYSSDKFYNGYTKIYDYLKGYNFINVKGDYLSNEWFFDAEEFSENFSVVKRITDNGIGYIMTKYKENKTPEEDDNLDKFIALEITCNFMGIDGKFLSDTWFSCVYGFQDGFATVKQNNKWNYINKTGKYLLDDWYYLVLCFSNNIGQIRNDSGKWNFVNRDGNVLFDEWFTYVDFFRNGVSKVKKDNKWNLVNNINGKLVFDEWVNTINVVDDVITVIDNTVIDNDGKKQYKINKTEDIISIIN